MIVYIFQREVQELTEWNTFLKSEEGKLRKEVKTKEKEIDTLKVVNIFNNFDHSIFFILNSNQMSNKKLGNYFFFVLCKLGFFKNFF